MGFLGVIIRDLKNQYPELEEQELVLLANVIHRTNEKIYRKDFPAVDIDNEAMFTRREREKLAIILVEYYSCGGWDVHAEVRGGENDPLYFRLSPKRSGKPENDGEVWQFIKEDTQSDLPITCYRGYRPKTRAELTERFSEFIKVPRKSVLTPEMDSWLKKIMSRLDTKVPKRRKAKQK